MEILSPIFLFPLFFVWQKFSQKKKQEISYNMILGFKITKGEDGKTRRPLKTHKKVRSAAMVKIDIYTPGGKIANLNQSIATTLKKKKYFFCFIYRYFFPFHLYFG